MVLISSKTFKLNKKDVLELDFIYEEYKKKQLNINFYQKNFLNQQAILSMEIT